MQAEPAWIDAEVAPALVALGQVEVLARPRAVAFVALLAAVPLAAGADGLVALGVLTALLVALVVAEQLRGAS